MRVQLDNGRTQVDIDVENGSEKFLHVVAKALRVLNYTEVDLLREFSTDTQEKTVNEVTITNTPPAMLNPNFVQPSINVGGK